MLVFDGPTRKFWRMAPSGRKVKGADAVVGAIVKCVVQDRGLQEQNLKMVYNEGLYHDCSKYNSTMMMIAVISA